MRHIHSASEISLNAFQSTLIEKLSDEANEHTIYITDADPINADKFDVLISDKCVVFSRFVKLDSAEKFKALAPNIPNLLNGIGKIIYSKLSTHRGLTYVEKSDIKIKMPFIVKLIFSEIRFEDIVDVDGSILSACIFSGQEEKLLDLLAGDGIDKNVQYPYKKDFKSINNDEKNLLVLVIAPEYTNTIPNDNRFADIEIAASVDKHFENTYKITPGDVYANAFCLDPEQIEIVNRITPGHWLIISPAGSGKSVLLLSTALRFTKAHPNHKVLIICRNRNLANVYEWKIAQSGVRNRNIQCFNVYRLFQHILTMAEVKYDPKEYDVNFEKALNVLERGQLDLAYTTIFIDEVQILREKYYKIFSHLIRRAKVVCLFGDIEQDININIINREYPWEIAAQLEFGNNIIKLDKNYRNTKQISDYAASFLELTKYYYERLGIQKDVFDENYIGGTAFKDGTDPVILMGSLEGEIKEIVKNIAELKETVSLSEVAVLFPSRQNRVQKYYLLDALRSELQNKKIPYAELISSDNVIASKIGVEKGVVLATIESVLGLDFKVVILCGLSLLGVFENSKAITLDGGNLTEARKKEFYKCCNMLYIAITRARSDLRLLLTQQSNQSVYSRLLNQAKSLKKRKEVSTSDAE